MWLSGLCYKFVAMSKYQTYAFFFLLVLTIILFCIYNKEVFSFFYPLPLQSSLTSNYSDESVFDQDVLLSFKEETQRIFKQALDLCRIVSVKRSYLQKRLRYKSLFFKLKMNKSIEELIKRMIIAEEAYLSCNQENYLEKRRLVEIFLKVVVEFDSFLNEILNSISELKI